MERNKVRSGYKITGIFLLVEFEMYLHSAELNVVAVTENVNTFLLV